MVDVHWPEWASQRDPDRRRRLSGMAPSCRRRPRSRYFGIGLGVLKIVDTTTPDTPDLFTFGAVSGAAFVLGTVLLLAFDHRGVWLLGALFQVGAIVMYVAISPQRTPPFEQWGILIKVLQVAILVALAYLVVRRPVRRTARILGPLTAPCPRVEPTPRARPARRRSCAARSGRSRGEGLGVGLARRSARRICRGVAR